MKAHHVLTIETDASLSSRNGRSSRWMQTLARHTAAPKAAWLSALGMKMSTDVWSKRITSSATPNHLSKSNTGGSEGGEAALIRANFGNAPAIFSEVTDLGRKGEDELLFELVQVFVHRFKRLDAFRAVLRP